MLTKIIEFSVKNKLIIALLVLGLIGIGSYQVTRLPIDAVPDITNNQVQVITVAPSFGATDIERLVTFPIEQANSNISGLKEIRSFSRFGLSLVTIVFDDGIDIYWARQQVAERLQQVQTQIPQGIGTPELGPISTGLGEIYQYVVRPKPGFEKKYDITELRTIQDWIVRRQLLGVKGVAEVSSFGGKLKQYEIAVNPDRLNAYGITINDVFTALETNNQNTGGAYIEKGPTVLYIRSEGLIGNMEDIRNIAIASKNNEIPLFIKDVAEVKTGFATRYGAMTYNDQGEVAGAIVMMLKGENSNQVIKNVKAKIASIQKTLPEGVVIEPFLDRTKMVNNAIGTVEKNLLEGALIVVFVLVLFLGNFRAGLLVASVIPLSMLFAICMMNLFGVSGNLMSLGALDFGLIIDGAVIIVESVLHRFSHHSKFKNITTVSQNKMDSLVADSAGKMMNSAVFGQMIILIVYLPILTLQGIEGKMFKPMAETVAFALLGAFLLSLTYIPMMSALLLKKRSLKPSFSDRMMKRIEALYLRTLLKVLRIPKIIFSVVLILFVLAILILSRLGGEFIPSLEEGDFAVETRVLPGSNLNTTIESTQKAAHILKSRFPEVEKVVTKIGSGEVPTDPMPMDASDMMVILKDKKDWASAETFPELADKMTRELEEVPGITVSFQYPVQMRFNELMTGARQDVVVKVFGDDLDVLVSNAQKLGKIIESVDGTQNLYIEPVSGMPQVIIEYNRPMIAQYHLSVADINRVINTAFAGQSAGLVFEGEKRFDTVVRLTASDRKNVSDIKNLLVPTPSGNQIPLSQLARIEVKNGPNQIQRENAQRRIVVGFNIKGRDVQSIVQELQEKVNRQIKLPAGYYVTYGGSFENLNNAKQRLMIAVPIALALIFVMLFLAFNSVKESLLIYTAIPLSIIGGVFLLALRGMPFSISAGIGFIALFGVAVLNGIVLISEFNRLYKSGIRNIVRIVIDGGESRLRPVLMTAFVASLGFIPMAVSNGAGGEVQRPLATVVIGGLMVATFLTLFVLPLLYVNIEKGFKMKKKKSSHTASVIILIFMLTAIPVKSQTTVSLDQAIQMALQNNRNLKSEKLRSEYSKALIKSARDIPQTAISADYGQINSAYNDIKLGVAQSIAFPTVYTKQKNVYTEEWKKSVLNVALKEYEIKKAVSLTFYEILYWKQKEQLLRETLTLYSDFLDKADLRLKAGESNILEKTTAANQKSAIEIQIKQVQQEIAVLRLQFQWLLNSETDFMPQDEKLYTVGLKDGLEQNPLLRTLEQQKNVAVQQTALEKAKLLPGLQLAYNLNSFRGTGPDDKVYNASPQFHSVQLGVSVPVFSGGQKARIQSAKIAETVAETDFQNTRFSLENQYKKLNEIYSRNLDIVSQYENSELKNAFTITDTAQKQFRGGEINYLDFVMLVNQAVTLKNNYADVLWKLNQSAIELEYLTLNP
ncbi:MULTISPECIES: CusA/CzcA family heavy metal efflux RND transporter [Chryseobacterium]|uniref:Cobalt-zinc-cadmium resistance protein CzcA n=1 Tax=Chryseobacterium camelliae TaxID=1265445 RepID=A0ABU0TE33_9FLAO|nr:MULTISPECIES: CusA/CzcA family heavy metal efflux RND transporter [Chryseobacterium]MDT3406871.1 cobalt-zinc-cadmium resistance protein CzcA [Pseudacidovorax intermedius]MDQ1095333.1 cobalt-zinc-cadmium resistance protein CzcA [Chryseobacterium camelliae]MDQ1099272.1 cobalt-zinc-cadmium resistance protein CzcA [Chryseobacterium sp. SORGH_AS_1048]MDR6086621.1 cobalt-zinc-cadmium resistance protein CzcA [Chryseobacterium sp. SORGH_AS_0909]MDR6130991.1 cobalt-zinc-cadmium resistance protein Cz